VISENVEKVFSKAAFSSVSVFTKRNLSHWSRSATHEVLPTCDVAAMVFVISENVEKVFSTAALSSVRVFTKRNLSHSRILPTCVAASMMIVISEKVEKAFSKIYKKNHY
jgi:hypothetical protein